MRSTESHRNSGGEPNKFLIRNVKYITSNGKHQYVIEDLVGYYKLFGNLNLAKRKFFSKTEIFQQNGNF